MKIKEELPISFSRAFGIDPNVAKTKLRELTFTRNKLMKPPKVGDKYRTRNGLVAEVTKLDIPNVIESTFEAIVTGNDWRERHAYSSNFDSLSDANFDLVEWIKPKS